MCICSSYFSIYMYIFNSIKSLQTHLQCSIYNTNAQCIRAYVFTRTLYNSFLLVRYIRI